MREIPRFARRFFDPPNACSESAGARSEARRSACAEPPKCSVATAEAIARSGIEVDVPSLVVLGTDFFDRFVESNRLAALLDEEASDRKIAEAFHRATIPAEMVGDLRALAQLVKVPLAVRSSSNLEDALGQPFAGVYGTKMIPSNAPDAERRFRSLLDAVKFVWASTWFAEARAYLASTTHRGEREQMAVLLQEVVGRRHGDRFYPDICGRRALLQFLSDRRRPAGGRRARPRARPRQDDRRRRALLDRLARPAPARPAVRLGERAGRGHSESVLGDPRRVAAALRPDGRGRVPDRSASWPRRRAMARSIASRRPLTRRPTASGPGSAGSVRACSTSRRSWCTARCRWSRPSARCSTRARRSCRRAGRDRVRPDSLPPRAAPRFGLLQVRPLAGLRRRDRAPARAPSADPGLLLASRARARQRPALRRGCRRTSIPSASKRGATSAIALEIESLNRQARRERTALSPDRFRPLGQLRPLARHPGALGPDLGGAGSGRSLAAGNESGAEPGLALLPQPVELRRALPDGRGERRAQGSIGTFLRRQEEHRGDRPRPPRALRAAARDRGRRPHAPRCRPPRAQPATMNDRLRALGRSAPPRASGAGQGARLPLSGRPRSSRTARRRSRTPCAAVLAALPARAGSTRASASPERSSATASSSPRASSRRPGSRRRRSRRTVSRSVEIEVYYTEARPTGRRGALPGRGDASSSRPWRERLGALRGRTRSRARAALASSTERASGWWVILEFLRQTDRVLLGRVGRRMIVHLCWNGVTPGRGAAAPHHAERARSGAARGEPAAAAGAPARRRRDHRGRLPAGARRTFPTKRSWP